MADFGFWDWLAYGGIVLAAVVIAIDAAIAQSEELRKHVPRLLTKPYVGFLPLVAIVISACAFAVKQVEGVSLSPPPGARIGSPSDFVQAWGVSNSTFYVIVNTARITSSPSLKRLVLIARASYANVDRMEDKHIIKSLSYTIEDGLITMAAINNGNLLAYLDKNTNI